MRNLKTALLLGAVVALGTTACTRPADNAAKPASPTSAPGAAAKASPTLVTVNGTALNAQLLAGCQQDESRLIAGQTQRVGEALAIERTHLHPLASERFDLQEVTFPTVIGAP